MFGSLAYGQESLNSCLVSDGGQVKYLYPGATSSPGHHT